MTDPRVVLDGIAQRAEAGLTTWIPSEATSLLVRAGEDVPRLVAALRAVLDLHVGDGEGYGGKVMCAYCSWLDEDMLVEFPCRTIRAIAEALGGGA